MMETRDFEATAMVKAACERHRIELGLLIAETALWAHPEVHRRLLLAHPTGAFFPGVRRARVGSGETRGSIIEGIKLDDNGAANQAIKKAIGGAPGRIKGFEACHLWPGTAYDERYHTVIANLTLLPRALAGLSDHDPAILAMLQYRSFELFGWHPAESPPPLMPPAYPICWREPEPFTAAIGMTLARRSLNASNGDAPPSLPSVERYLSRVGSDELRQMSPELMPDDELLTVKRRIRRWAERPHQKVHKILGLMVRAETAMPRHQLARAIEALTGSVNGQAAVANLLTSNGNAYGRVLIDRGGRVEIHPAVLDEIRRHHWV